MTVSLCVLLWAHPGEEAGLRAYEDTVLALIPDHGGRVVHRIYTTATGDEPHEVQFIDMESLEAVADYINDPRRQALTEERDRVIARTEIRYLSAEPPQ